MRTAICSGSFDPITLGHMDIIHRAAQCFDQVYVCVLVNCDKKPMFSADERVDMIRRSVADLPNVEAELWPGLLADFAVRHHASAIVRGVRNTTDFDVEYQMALINRGIHPELETLLLPADPAYIYLSSTVAREMIHYHQPLDKYLPKAILPLIRDWTEQR